MDAISPKLLERVRETLRTKHYSYRTEQAYVDWIKRFIIFHNKRHPRDMGAEEVQAFITYLANDRRMAASTHIVLALGARRTRPSAPLYFYISTSSKKSSFFHPKFSAPAVPNASPPCSRTRKPWL
jgi:uracil-DNA glycosylase